MLIASPRTHAFIFLTIGLVLLAIYCAGPGLTERSVLAGPVIASAEFQATPDGFLASSRKAEKMLKQKVSLQPNQKYRVQFVIAGSSDPALVVVDLAGTSFQLRLNAAGHPLKVDRVLDAGNPARDLPFTGKRVPRRNPPCAGRTENLLTANPAGVSGEVQRDLLA